ncbi:hypothetical protein B0H13DRAFT_1912850 [Mycena leptocephala]|nr:hypothetical protein B0H13DRAFT_1912850 [Mycena leptocephala]
MSSHPLWAYFHNLGVKQNKSHYESHCKGCVSNERKLLQEAGKKWVKTSLAILFGDALKKPVIKIPQKELDREAGLMEALAEAEEDARPDDGAIECSDDENMP